MATYIINNNEINVVDSTQMKDLEDIIDDQLNSPECDGFCKFLRRSKTDIILRITQKFVYV